MDADYTAEELFLIRDCISKRIYPPMDDIKKYPWYMLSFFDLKNTLPDIYNKISEDKRAQEFSYVGFFPETYPIVYGSSVSPVLQPDAGNRGPVAIIKHPSKNLVIKPYQNSREKEIAQNVADLEVGPKQYASLDQYLTEEFIDGKSIAKIHFVSDDEMYSAGRRFGDIMTKLHSNDILYNDVTLVDDYGRSHLFFPENKPAVLIDFGVALKLDKHPDLSLEDIFHYVNSIAPITRESVAFYSDLLKNSSKEAIFKRDLELVGEGFYFLGFHNINVSALKKGFDEAYTFG